MGVSAWQSHTQSSLKQKTEDEDPQCGSQYNFEKSEINISISIIKIAMFLVINRYKQTLQIKKRSMIGGKSTDIAFVVTHHTNLCCPINHVVHQRHMLLINVCCTMGQGFVDFVTWACPN